MLAAQAAFTQSLQVVTVYATLGEEGLIHGTTQTKSKVIVCDAKLLKVVASAIKKDKSGMKSCTGVVFIADPVQKPDPKAAALIETSLEALKKAGIKVPQPPKPTKFDHIKGQVKFGKPPDKGLEQKSGQPGGPG